MDDITEVRPAPHLPPDVQGQADRAQWVLYLLRRSASRPTQLSLSGSPRVWREEALRVAPSGGSPLCELLPRPRMLMQEWI